MSIDPFEGAIPSGDPVEESMELKQKPRYAGFWIRLVASLIDSVLIMILVLPILEYFFANTKSVSTRVFDGNGLSTFDFESTSTLTGTGQFIYILAVLVIVMLFWIYRAATPGKMLLGLKIVDADSLEPLSKNQGFVRYFGYYLAFLPLCLGFFWVAFDKRKQGWHDKLAKTLVIYENKKSQQ